MVRLIAAGWMLAALLACGPHAHAQDALRTERHTFTITVSGGVFSATEEVEERRTMVSTRAAEARPFAWGEQYFNPMSDLRVDIDGRAVDRRQFSTATAESRDAFLSDGTFQRLDLREPLSSGQVMTTRFRRTYLDVGYLPMLYVWNADAIERYEIVVRHPPDVEVAFDVAQPRGAVPHSINRSATETSIAFADLAPVREIPLFAHNDYHAAVLIHLRRNGETLGTATPAALARWYADLLAPVDTTLTPRLRELAETLRRDTPEATVAAIHDHVRSSIRYIADLRGVGALRPRAPDLVHDRAYGDCKDRAMLAASLARALGLRVDLVLIGTEEAAPTAGVGIGLYNHVICAFGPPGRRVYFDPTRPYLPYGDLPEGDVDGRALRLGADGPEDLHVPAQDSLPGLDVVIPLRLDAPADAEATVVVRGSALDPLREVMARGTRTDLPNAVSAIAGSLLQRIRLSRLELVEDETHALTFRGRADLSAFVVASPTRRYLPLTPFDAVPAGASARRADSLSVSLPVRPNVRLRLLVEPGAWRVEPFETRWGGPLASFEARAESDDAGALVTYHFRQRTRRFEGAARTEYLDLAERYLRARREVLTFQPTTD